MIIRTRNSVYEVDADLRVRRLYGEHAPQPRQGIDGVWKQALRVVLTQYYGEPCFLFAWKHVDGIDQCTMTSAVQSIEGTEEQVEYVISAEDLLRDVRTPDLDN